MKRNCVSQWAHVFRPACGQLGAAAEALGRPPILALTAPAPADVNDMSVLLRYLDEHARTCGTCNGCTRTTSSEVEVT